MTVDFGNIKGVEKILNKDGRILIPVDFRRILKMKANDTLNIYLFDNGIFIRKEK